MEYLLQFVVTEKASVEDALMRLGAKAENGPAGVRYEFRAVPSRKGMSDASAILDKNGLYFCDHGGHGREFLGRLAVELVRRFGPLAIRDYDQ